MSRLGLLLCALLTGCETVRDRLVTWFTPEYAPATTRTEARGVRLELVATGVPQPTDVAFPPGSGRMWVLGKEGAIWCVAPGRRPVTLATVAVETKSEMGLLGIAFSPGFPAHGRFYLDYTTSAADGSYTTVALWEHAERGRCQGRARFVRELLVVRQPYGNHNGGQLQVGPDGHLYVALGDGGWRGDPHDHAQNVHTLLGSILRLTVDPLSGQVTTPGDNPFAAGGGRPELWAWGLRNPWRFSFAPDGRLLAADVGQDRYEELDVVVRGGNYGWRLKEGRACYDPPEGCERPGLIDPILVYGRDLGASITGGYVYLGRELPWLRGRYVFGDFVSGRIWALELPPGVTTTTRDLPFRELGRWPLLISTFGRDPNGELYVADFGGGRIYRLAPAGVTAAP